MAGACWQGNEMYVPQSATALPAVCVKCGRPASVLQKKTYYWHTPWLYLLILIGLLVYAVAAICVRKKMMLNVPLCAEHAGKLRNLKITTAVLLIGFLPVGIAGSMLGEAYVGWAWLAALAMFLAGLVSWVMVGRCYLTPKHIDASYARFRGPCAQFLRALPMKA